MSKTDVEKLTKDRLKKLDDVAAEFSIVPMPVEHVRALLNRLDVYRQRLKEVHDSYHRKMGPLQRKVSDQESTLAMARERMDPERYGTHFSECDQYRVGEHIKAIEKVRGRIVAQRLLYGQPADTANETLGVLEAAIEETNREKQKWYNYLNDARTKAS